jgi:hypothetical protein
MVVGMLVGLSKSSIELSMGDRSKDEEVGEF